MGFESFIPPDVRKAIEDFPDDVAVEQPQSSPLPTPDDKRIGFFMHPDKAPLVTSRKAAIRLYPNSGTKRRQVLDAIGRSREHGLVDDEIEIALGMRHTTCSARRKELWVDGWIEQRNGSDVRNTSSGSPAAIWVLSEQGRAEWQPV